MLHQFAKPALVMIYIFALGTKFDDHVIKLATFLGRN